MIYTIVMPKPTYLGDAIPVSGDGNVTNDKEENRAGINPIRSRLYPKDIKIPLKQLMGMNQLFSGVFCNGSDNGTIRGYSFTK
mgnify:CR=1 FL=1